MTRQDKTSVIATDQWPKQCFRNNLIYAFLVEKVEQMSRCGVGIFFGSVAVRPFPSRGVSEPGNCNPSEVMPKECCEKKTWGCVLPSALCLDSYRGRSINSPGSLGIFFIKLSRNSRDILVLPFQKRIIVLPQDNGFDLLNIMLISCAIVSLFFDRLEKEGKPFWDLIAFLLFYPIFILP